MGFQSFQCLNWTELNWEQCLMSSEFELELWQLLWVFKWKLPPKGEIPHLGFLPAILGQAVFILACAVPQPFRLMCTIKIINESCNFNKMKANYRKCRWISPIKRARTLCRISNNCDFSLLLIISCFLRNNFGCKASIVNWKENQVMSSRLWLATPDHSQLFHRGLKISSIQLQS